MRGLETHLEGGFRVGQLWQVVVLRPPSAERVDFRNQAALRFRRFG